MVQQRHAFSGRDEKRSDIDITCVQRGLDEAFASLQLHCQQQRGVAVTVAKVYIRSETHKMVGNCVHVVVHVTEIVVNAFLFGAHGAIEAERSDLIDRGNIPFEP